MSALRARHFRIVAVASGLLLSIASASVTNAQAVPKAQPQNSGVDEVTQQTNQLNQRFALINRMSDDLSAAAARAGWHQTSDPPRTGSLNVGVTETTWFNLDGKNDSIILAECDDNCSYLHVALFEPAGDEIDSTGWTQATGEELALVENESGMFDSGSYKVEVRMDKCSAEPCRYVLRLFTK